LTGPSGSGKTTLLSLMGGLRSAQQGSLRILDQELLGASKKQLVDLRSHIGYIFQAHNLLDCLTAQEQRCTILLVTHDNRILDIAHRIIHMEDGRLIKTERPAVTAV
jgi:putative ABC transport system ATP-binding protein